ncbi:MAG: Methyltransferase [uncultured bacterium]|nr:MAG: Methyltransferase [uncultured bacterium]HBR79247.1 hypothetical protein [Candidatus Moranbacteria bacterium]HCU01348.1 hypothetical protein [Candidatus Nomurabacteria bacterium]
MSMKFDISKKWSIFLRIKTSFYEIFLQKFIVIKNSKKEKRFLEIGPGEERIFEFETINIVKTKNTDYIGDATKKINFPDKTFDVIYASHILEHTPWYMLNKTINEWIRVLKPGGTLEVWVPNSLKIAKAFCDAEDGINTDYVNDGWFRFNEDRDPAKWFSGRVFSYGDGSGTRGHFNFHLSAFSERFLKKIFIEAGLANVTVMENCECRGYDHGWINLGIKGVKK